MTTTAPSSKSSMLTGQRAGEIGGLRWSEIDFERAMISLPGERTKNGRPHEIPMARTVLEMLRARVSKDDDRDLVFGVRGGPWGRLGTRKGGARRAHRLVIDDLGPSRPAPNVRHRHGRHRHPAAHHRSRAEPRQRT